jgi:L-ascorbate metabolism protein UlaG (beta-lactamase superfamily)
MRFSGLFLIVHTAAFAAAVPNHQTDSIETSQGMLKLTPLFHGSVMLEFGGKIFHVDPWSQADYAGVPQADMILITHTHADHMDPAIIKMLKKRRPSS